MVLELYGQEGVPGTIIQSSFTDSIHPPPEPLEPRGHPLEPRRKSFAQWCSLEAHGAPHCCAYAHWGLLPF